MKVLQWAVALCISVTALWSCAPRKITNTPYRLQVKNMIGPLEKPPLLPSENDSLKGSTTQYSTPNFGMRKPNFIIIHHTAQNSCDATLRTFADSAREVSAHYVICKDGITHHLLSDYLRAWHAGSSKWGTINDINSISLGIELDNNGNEPFSYLQTNALLSLLGILKDSFKIPTANFLGHSDIAPGRKVDPSKYFPWELLSKEGFGYWYDTTSIIVPAGFDPILGLRTIGYDIKDPVAALRSFRLHFLQKDMTTPVTTEEKKIIYNLMQKYL